MWEYKQASVDMEDDSIMTAAATATGQDSLAEPRPVYTHNVPASVMDMQFIDRDTLAVCLSNGSLAVMKYWPTDRHKVIKRNGTCIM